MPVTHRKGSATGSPAGTIQHFNVRATAEREVVLEKQAEKDFKPQTDPSIGIMFARNAAQEAGIDPARVDAALAANEIDGAEKQGTRWFIPTASFQTWLAGQS